MDKNITRKTINPSSLCDSSMYGFSHAVESSGVKTIHCAGQVAWDRHCNLVGDDDIVAQARQALDNLTRVLSEAGASAENVVRMRTYVVGHKPEYLESVGAAISDFYGDTEPAANTWIGVQTLALPEFLIEIEATAVV